MPVCFAPARAPAAVPGAAVSVTSASRPHPRRLHLTPAIRLCGVPEGQFLRRAGIVQRSIWLVNRLLSVAEVEVLLICGDGRRDRAGPADPLKLRWTSR